MKSGEWMRYGLSGYELKQFSVSSDNYELLCNMYKAGNYTLRREKRLTPDGTYETRYGLYPLKKQHEDYAGAALKLADTLEELIPYIKLLVGV